MIAAGDPLPTAEELIAGPNAFCVVVNGKTPYAVTYHYGPEIFLRPKVVSRKAPLSIHSTRSIKFWVMQAEPLADGGGRRIKLPHRIILTGADRRSASVDRSVFVEFTADEAASILRDGRPAPLRLDTGPDVRAWPDVAEAGDDGFPDPPLTGGEAPYLVHHFPGRATDFGAPRVQRNGERAVQWPVDVDDPPEYLLKAIEVEVRRPDRAKRAAEFQARTGRRPTGRPVWVETRVAAWDAARQPQHLEIPRRVLADVPAILYDRLAA